VNCTAGAQLPRPRAGTLLAWQPLASGQRIGAPRGTAGQIRRACGVDQLNAQRLTGAGQTIVLIDSYGSPTIQNDLQVFDRTNHLPAPPSFQVITPGGTPPAWNPTQYPDQPGWAGETTLDVEFSHAMAPGANLILVETPVDETAGVQGVTVLAATGDDGATDYELDGTDNYPVRVVDWPSSDPRVTAVGGTELSLDQFGNRIRPDMVWNDPPAKRFGGEFRARAAVASRPCSPGRSSRMACNMWSAARAACGTSDASPLFPLELAALADRHRY
jgi:subtilase family serine protease